MPSTRVLRSCTFLCLTLSMLAGASPVLARKFRLERSRSTGYTHWGCKDGSAQGWEPTRGGARRAGRAACGFAVATDPTGPSVTFDAAYQNFPEASATRFLSTTGGATDREPGTDASGSGSTATVGVVVPVSSTVSLDLGLFYGTAQVRQDVTSRTADGFLRRGVEKVDFDLFGGDAAIRLYPVEGDRVRPWAALGIRDSFSRPRNVRVDGVTGQSTEISDRELKTVRETSAFARAGIDLRWSEKGRVTFSGEYGERDFWSARFGVGFALGSTQPPSPPRIPEPAAVTVVKPCRWFCRLWGRRIDRTDCSTAPDGLSHGYSDIETRYRFFSVTGYSITEAVAPGPCP